LKKRDFSFRFPLREALFEQKGAERDERGASEEEGANERPPMALPSGEDEGDIGYEEDAMDPAGPFDELGAACQVFEGHSDPDEDQKGKGFQATNESEKGWFLRHKQTELFELRDY